MAVMRDAYQIRAWRASSRARDQHQRHECADQREAQGINAESWVKNKNEAMALDQSGEARDAQRHQVQTKHLPGLESRARRACIRSAEVQTGPDDRADAERVQPQRQ